MDQICTRQYGTQPVCIYTTPLPDIVTSVVEALQSKLYDQMLLSLAILHFNFTNTTKHNPRMAINSTWKSIFVRFDQLQELLYTTQNLL